MHPYIKYLGVAAALTLVGVLAFNTIQQGREPVAQACTTEAKICPDGSAVGRTGPHCEFAACPNGDAQFQKQGVITVGNPGQPQSELVFVYEQPGSPALHKMLTFDTESMCVSGTGMISCLAMNVGFDVAFAGKRVTVTGIDRGSDLLVRRLEIVDATAPQAKRETVTAKIGQTVSVLGVSITPLEIVDDSRCPEDVQCIWAGTTHVRAKLVSGMGESEVTFEIGQSITTEAEFVTLTSVNPAPKAGVTISPADYRLTFEVAKR